MHRCARGLRPQRFPALERRDNPCAGVGKSFLAVPAATRNGVSNAGKELAGTINARKEILFVRSRYTHAYTALQSRRRGRSRPVVAAYPGRPQAEHRRVPGTPGECTVPSARRCSKGTSRQASLTEKTHSFSQQRSRKQKAVAAVRRGATRHGAPRFARKNIIYVRHDGRPIAHRFAPRPLFVLILLRSDVMHDALNSPISKVLPALFAFNDYPE